MRDEGIQRLTEFRYIGLTASGVWGFTGSEKQKFGSCPRLVAAPPTALRAKTARFRNLPKARANCVCLQTLGVTRKIRVCPFHANEKVRLGRELR